MNFRPTQVVIDLGALRYNAKQLLARLPKKCKAIGMVKADGYNHGAVPVAKTLIDSGFAALSVATVEEGIELREASIKSPILAMGGLWGLGREVCDSIFEYQLIPVIHSLKELLLLEEKGKKLQEKVEVHLKIDTGMGRLGITLQDLPELMRIWKKCDYVKLEGVMTHLAWRENEEYTAYQLDQFAIFASEIQKSLGNIAVWHLANSASLISGRPITLEYPGDYWVRPGIMLYGVPPYLGWERKFDVKPVMRLESKIGLIKEVPAGTKISYNCTFTTKRPSRIAVLPIGYADGYPWACSNKGEVLIRGKRRPVIGRVTMDMTLVDVTETKAQIGDEVVLLGDQQRERISADELAQWAGTIAYEIVCGISKRVPRKYIGN